MEEKPAHLKTAMLHYASLLRKLVPDGGRGMLERKHFAGSTAGRLALDKFFDQQLRQPIGIMTHDAVLLEQIIE